MRTLIILNDVDISRLADNKHVPLCARNRLTGEKEMIVMMSDKCYDAYKRGEYDVEEEELARQSINPGLMS